MGKIGLKKLKYKMLLFIGVAVMICSIAGNYLTISAMREKTDKLVNEASHEKIDKYSLMAQEMLSMASKDAKELVDTALILKENEATREMLTDILKSILKNNDEYVGVWTCWEDNSYDNNDYNYQYTENHDKTGRLIPRAVKSRFGIGVETFKYYDKEGDGEYYLKVKNAKKPMITDPHIGIFDDKEELITSIVYPIIHNNKFLGAMGIDIKLSKLKDQLTDVKILESGYAALISSDGKFVAHKNMDLLGEDFIGFKEDEKIRNCIVSGEEFDDESKSEFLNKKVHRLIKPVNIEGMDDLWAFLVDIPKDELSEISNNTRDKLRIINIITLIIILAIIYILANKITKPIEKTTVMLKDIAEGEGDLTKRLEVVSQDEVGELSNWFNIFIGKIGVLIGDAKDSAVTLSENTSLIEEAINENNHSLEVVSTSVGEVAVASESNASLVEEINANLEEVANSAVVMKEASHTAVESSKEIFEIVEQGRRRVKALSENNEELEGSITTVNDVIQKLSKSSENIGQILKVITDISEQTNLLALNAAIEAARAGEHGAGFAVVADEVRKLAEESKNSAVDITEIVREIQLHIINADKSAAEGKNIVDSCVKRSAEIERRFNRIYKRVESITAKSEEIYDLSSQQANGSEEMSSAMENISQALQTNVHNVNNMNNSIENQVSIMEEITASVQEVNNRADELRNDTDRFKI
ncbi:methyl-accepting chemotaxis protein [Oceanirhabdus seepicola]|uniref:Methyl-accepting chemotaxis protein n=1 Tax=Oceanirhabdus seepicola TaxID=2828781 RepID=A0A9J6P5Q8_9CLOT|nr:methyl-accepting chemotaxis protein [Oceanirhabdus seepicola]MCM1991470.1 methyl-accepting chemotaxis protein [Oceanirhabdus seepicola]